MEKEEKINNFVEMFELQVRKNPDKIAVVFNEQKISYADLNQKANRLAGKIRDTGAGQGKVIGIMLDESVEIIIAMLAILKTGSAFLPIDYSFPHSRIEYIIKDSKMEVLITKHEFVLQLKQDIDVIDVYNTENYNYNAENLSIIIKPDDLAYVIYTSGTTGMPKGVMIEEKNLSNYIEYIIRNYDINNTDKAGLISSFCFDLGYTVIFPTLACGAELHLVKRKCYINPNKLCEYLYNKKITFIKCTPSMFAMITNSYEFNNSDLCGGLKKIFLGGEHINAEDVIIFHNKYPATKIINHYGPTETTIGIFTYEIDWNKIEQFRKTPVIGKPIQNVEIYILDEGGNSVPRGEIGELYVEGAALARGYLNKEKLTNEKFFIYTDSAGKKHRLYKTGDKVRYVFDNNIQIIGRIDEQVKVRGYRIELGDVETQLRKYKKVDYAAVLAKSENNGGTALYAYLVLNEECTAKELIEYLKKNLPDYMIPGYFIIAEEIPITPNGKLDKNALERYNKRLDNGYIYEAARNSMETDVVRTMQEVLKIEGIGINQNFFQLGGNSVNAVQVMTKLHKYGFSLEELYLYPTVKLLCENHKYIENERFYEKECYLNSLNDIKKLHIDNNVINVEKKVISGVKPFNDSFYKDCFYNALFPVIQYSSQKIDFMIANDLFLYSKVQSADEVKITAKLFSDSSVENELIDYYGIFPAASYTNENFIENTKNAICNERFVIARVDCMYEEIRPDFYKKNHFPHALLVCGFDDVGKKFLVMEQDDANRLNYEIRYIDYNDLNNSNREYQYYYADNRIPVYYEFYLDIWKYAEENREKDPKKRYIDKVCNNSQLIEESLTDLCEFTGYFIREVLDADYLAEHIESLVYQVNTVLTVKKAEQYKLTRLFDSSSKLTEINSQIVKKWNYIKVVLEKYKYSKIFRKDAMFKAGDMLKLIYKQENEFYKEVKAEKKI